jgi:hypothetical protein
VKNFSISTNKSLWQSYTDSILFKEDWKVIRYRFI